jgi:small subunit ribosomal protein S3Ae
MLCDSQVRGDYAKEDAGVQMERPAEGDLAMWGQEVAASEW